MITAYNSDTGFMIRKKKFFDPRELNIFKLPKHDLPSDPLPDHVGESSKTFRAKGRESERTRHGSRLPAIEDED